MLRVTVLERGRIERVTDLTPSATPDQLGTPARRRLPATLYDRLWRAEGAREDRGEKAIFTWGRNRAYVGPWVGVVQVPGLQLELLPKADDRDLQDDKEVEEVRANLLHMLELSGLTDLRERGMADVRARRGMLLDQLAARFVARLLEELRRGADRTYTAEEGNLLAMRGRLMLARQVTINAAHRHRFYCAYDALSEDTPINRTLRSACDVLRQWTLPLGVQRSVAEAAALLDEVPPLPDPLTPPKVIFTRQNERLKDIFKFAVLLLSGLTPDVKAGANQTFALLFNMDKLFEGYIARFLERYVEPEIPGLKLHPQPKDHNQYLFHAVSPEGSKNALRLTPDLLFHYERESTQTTLIIDTKWKRLNAKEGYCPSNTDLYQLYAYVHRFGCLQAILLYPRVADEKEVCFQAMGSDNKQPIRQVSTKFVNMSGSLSTIQGKRALADELTRLLKDALKNPPVQTAATTGATA